MKTTQQMSGDVGAEPNPLDSFGIVTLASLYPVNAVFILGLICKAVYSKEDIVRIAEERAAAAASEDADSSGGGLATPWSEIVYATRSVVPLIGILVLLIKKVLKENLPYITLQLNFTRPEGEPDLGKSADARKSLPNRKTLERQDTGATAKTSDEILIEDVDGPAQPGGFQVHCFLGVLEAYLGLIIFNIGLKYGLGPFGDMVGSAVPGLWAEKAEVPGSPLIESYGVAVFVIAVFAFFMALVATYAEPALNAMGMTIELLSGGSFTKSLLMLSVAVGVATGVTVGMLRHVLGWPLVIPLCIGYCIAIPATYPSLLEYVAVSWDAAGVTTGSITVPLVLKMGLGLGAQLGLMDGFGLLAMGSVGPIISVLLTGLYVQYKRPNEHETELVSPNTKRMSSAGRDEKTVDLAASWYMDVSVKRSLSLHVNENTLIQRMKESGLAMSQNGVDISRTASAPGIIIQRSMSRVSVSQRSQSNPPPSTTVSGSKEPPRAGTKAVNFAADDQLASSMQSPAEAEFREDV
jgi:hypothetical protein